MFEMGSLKSEIKRFTRKNDFNVWRMRMKTILFQQGVKDGLKDESKLPVTMMAKDKLDIDEKAYHLIILALEDKSLRRSQKKLQLRVFGTSLSNFIWRTHFRTGCI